MLKRFITVFLSLTLIISSAGCGASKKTRYEAEFLQLFDTVTKIVAYTDSKEEFTKFSNLIHDNLKVYHELYDIYHNYPGINNIKTINDNAGKKPVKVDKKIIDLLKFAKDEYKNTNGKMNVAMGAVLKIWHDHREAGIADPENATLPSIDELRKAAGHTDINKLVIDEAKSEVYLEDPEMSLDVGGVAKGYATEQVSLFAEKNGFTSGLISVGGNVRAIGNKGIGSQKWNLGIQNPDKSSSDSILDIVYVNDKSVVSSGVYERYYVVNGQRYHHIIDPVTLFPADYFLQVTIICKDSGKADALCKPVFIMPFDEGLKYINSIPDVAAMWVMKNGEKRYSDNFKDYMAK